jgi:hypothetical protein
MCRIISLIHYLQNEKKRRRVTKEREGRDPNPVRSRDVIEGPRERAAVTRVELSSE